MLTEGVMPAVEAAIAAYGAGVLTRTEDAAADGTVRLGQRLLRRLLDRAPDRQAVGKAVAAAASDPADQDFSVPLRAKITRLLAADPQLATEIADLLAGAGQPVVAAGERSVASQVNAGIIQTGDHASVRREEHP